MLRSLARLNIHRSLRLAPRSRVGPALATARLPFQSTVPVSRQIRYHSTDNSDNKTATLKGDAPQLMIAFTCTKCDTRSSHTFSKQSYTKGTVLIQCPGCKGRHLIADNLKIFRDNNVNLEDILQAKGESVATTTDDLAFEDIPESLRKTIGHHAKDAPEEYQKKYDNQDNGLPPTKD
ncbi:hypothetical protein CXQ85_000771 [Candidozyma haemuli]|uniref:DNL-type domain-containing protein n=1 Tax=Candidozyma haemuli TaxID=45357 RepID=A0A2V1AUL1_9ASCO|nr:hypothetical protein CXQ85_000771 [[Candida] haemuloni]PVH21780.1 hypothetical protein CXQ85_000771 [[Candida] haemuloni]